jgi:uncharacterized membrane protein YdjX (TVP38/TMEM64 family)
VQELLRSFQGWVVGLGPLGWALYALVYALCCVLFVPGSILTLGAGALYGLGTGVAIVFVGANLAAAVSFLLARTILRKRIERMTAGNPKFAALDKAIAREGAKIVFLVRLSPVFPFTYVNYAFGLTGVKTLPYLVATFFGMIPGTFAYVYLGAAAATAASGSVDATKKAIQVAGAVVAVLVSIFVARVAAKAIKGAGVEDTKAPPAPGTR